jgi:hypothetical protein
VTCSGSATGTIQFDPREIVLTYDSFGCDVRTADGTYSATWTRSDGTVSFQGDWDLTVDPADGVATAILGGGVADYVDADATTTIVSWSGTLTREEQTWNVTMTNLAVSYQNNQNLIPGSGTIVVTGTQLGTVATTFDADSPTTGEVSVSINGGPEFPYTLSR